MSTTEGQQVYRNSILCERCFFLRSTEHCFEFLVRKESTFNFIAFFDHVLLEMFDPVLFELNESNFPSFIHSEVVHWSFSCNSIYECECSKSRRTLSNCGAFSSSAFPAFWLVGNHKLWTIWSLIPDHSHRKCREPCSEWVQARALKISWFIEPRINC